MSCYCWSWCSLHRRTNAGMVWVSAPGDYATFNSNHTPDGTWRIRTSGSWSDLLRRDALPGDLPVSGPTRRRNENHAVALEANPAHLITADPGAREAGPPQIRGSWVCTTLRWREMDSNP